MGEERELSFEGLGLKLNSMEDATDVADKIRATKEMHILTLAGNTVGIEAAKAIGSALEVKKEKKLLFYLLFFPFLNIAEYDTHF